MKDIIVTHTDPKSTVSEAFRNLRTNVHYSNIDKEIKILQVTSSIQNEGKSTVAANYAVTVAQGGKKVLLMDCDLRKPKVHKLFNVNNKTGLSNILVGDATTEHNIQKTKVENLFILTSGPIPPNPSEMLDSRRMKELMESVADYFDMVVVDSPPILPVTDGLILSKIADGTVLVVSLGSTQKDALKKTVEALENIDANIIGTVVNKASTRSRYYAQYEYEYK